MTGFVLVSLSAFSASAGEGSVAVPVSGWVVAVAGGEPS
jgi:hypothetical protein